MPADDDEASGPPPHPLDRVWFHPSELGAPVTALRPQPAAPRVWVAAALALVIGILGTLGVVSVVGTFHDGTPTNRLQRTVATPVDTERIETLVQTTGRSITRISVVPAGGSEATAVGSGVSIGDGQVLTAAHLVTNQTSVAVVTVGGQVAKAKVLGIDPETDLALLKVDGVELATAQLAIGGSTLRAGKSVTALASSAGNRPVVGSGLIQQVNQFVTFPSGVRGAAMVATDATVANAQLAGGALLDTETGGVIGILTGDGYAVPIDIARSVADQIGTTGQAVHGWLGVVTREATDRQGGGVRVQTVVPGSPAATAVDLMGTQAIWAGDVITAVGKTDVANTGELVAAVRRLRPQDPVDLTLIRNDKITHVQVPALGTSQALTADLAPVA